MLAQGVEVEEERGPVCAASHVFLMKCGEMIRASADFKRWHKRELHVGYQSSGGAKRRGS